MAAGRVLNIQVAGSGYVIAQRPAVGQPLDGSPIKLTLGEQEPSARAPQVAGRVRIGHRGGA